MFEGSVIMYIIGCVDMDDVGFGILLTWERIGGWDRGWAGATTNIAILMIEPTRRMVSNEFLGSGPGRHRIYLPV